MSVLAYDGVRVTPMWREAVLATLALHITGTQSRSARRIKYVGARGDVC